MNLGIMGTAGTLILTVLTTLNGSTPNHEVTDDDVTEVTRGNVTFIYTDPSPYDLDPALDPCGTSVDTTQDPTLADEDEDSMIYEDPLAGTPAGSDEEEYGDALPEDWPTEVPEWVLRQYEECPPWNGAENS